MMATRTQTVLIGAVIIAAVAFAVDLLLSSCVPAPSNLPTLVDVESYSAALDNCVETADSRPAADACQTEQRAQLCRMFPAIDGCATDAGGQ